MTSTAGNLAHEIRRLAAELNELEKRLRTEPEPDLESLNELRHAVDNTRLTAWSVSELMTGKAGRNRHAALALERLRRLDHIILSISRDIEAGAIPADSLELQSLRKSASNLENLLAREPK